MTDTVAQQAQLADVLKTTKMLSGVQIRCWAEMDMPAIQRLSDLHGWPTNHEPEEVMASWRNAWPALVATKDEAVVGYVRGLTDQHVLLLITDLLVAENYREHGIGRLLLDVCHLLYPRTLMTLVAEKAAIPFYTKIGFRYGGESYMKSFQRKDADSR